MKVYLDGVEVEPEAISPARHRFLGMFRLPNPPHFTMNWWCPGCGECTQVVGQEHRHWREGHFDVPQYVSIEADECGNDPSDPAPHLPILCVPD